MNETRSAPAVVAERAETPPPLPLLDRLMLYLFAGLFVLFSAVLLAELIVGLLR